MKKIVEIVDRDMWKAFLKNTPLGSLKRVAVVYVCRDDLGCQETRGST